MAKVSNLGALGKAPAGTYRVEVRASSNGNGDIRSWQLDKPLTVS